MSATPTQETVMAAVTVAILALAFTFKAVDDWWQARREAKRVIQGRLDRA